MRNEKGQPVCCVCHKHRVAHEHVICRVCNERGWHGTLTSEEQQRKTQELQYRYRQDHSEKA